MLDKAEVTSLLGRTTMFGVLGEPELAGIAGQMVVATFKPRARIFARGDPGDDVHLVIGGRIRLSLVSSEGRELTLLHAGRGEIVGEIAALDGGMRTADAHAVGTVVTARLRRQTVLELLDSNARVAQAAVGFLCARLRATNDVLEAIALHPIEVRLARFLLAAARCNGSAGSLPVEIRLGISQADLALLIGASRPKVTTALQVLEAAHAITRKGETMVCDMAALARMADSG